MGVKVSISGDKEIKRKLQKLAKLAPLKLKEELARSAFAIDADYKRNVPVDVGILRSSIKIEWDDMTVAVGTNSKYGPYVEFGTRPHFPPVAPLEEWARRHGMEPGAGFVIARKIAEKGTPAQPALMPAYEQEKPAFLAACKVAVHDAANEASR